MRTGRYRISGADRWPLTMSLKKPIQKPHRIPYSGDIGSGVSIRGMFNSWRSRSP